jgi:hypothetical protein
VISVGVLLSVDSAGAAPTGTVTIQNGSTALGSAPLYGIVAVGTTPTWGSATFDSSSLPPGTYNITAVYSGDGNYGSSTSPVVSLTLGRANSSITVSTSATIISANQPLQVTVTPAPLAGLPLPTGSATLTYGSVTTPPADLVNGTASFTIPPNSLPLGFGPIAGNYSGDADYASGSANAWVTVNSSGTVKPIVTVTGFNHSNGERAQWRPDTDGFCDANYRRRPEFHAADEWIGNLYAPEWSLSRPESGDCRLPWRLELHERKRKHHS